YRQGAAQRKSHRRGRQSRQAQHRDLPVADALPRDLENPRRRNLARLAELRARGGTGLRLARDEAAPGGTGLGGLAALAGVAQDQGGCLASWCRHQSAAGDRLNLTPAAYFFSSQEPRIFSAQFL